MRLARAASALVALALAGSACGGGTTETAARSGNPVPASKAHVSLAPGPPTEVPDPLAAMTAAPESPSPGATPGDDGGSPPPLPTDVNGVRRAPLEVVMGSACATPGSLQTITIRAPEGFDVAWATLWPDGDGHQDWNGWSTGKIPPGGEYRSTFTIPPQAPTGEARTDVTVTGKTDGEWAARMAHPFWEIRAEC